jgi:hypothetical protein
MSTGPDRPDGAAGPESPPAAAAAKRDRRSRDPQDWIHRRIEKYRRHGVLAFRPDEQFFQLADPVVTTRRTLLGYDRLYVFWQAIGNVQGLPGAVAEIGSYRGGSAYFLASSFLAVTGKEATIHVFDTFEGHPAIQITERDNFHKPGQFSDTSYEDVRDYLSPFASLQVHKGDVSLSLPRLEETSYRLVHIDTDLYRPTLECLEYFTPRLVPGGVVVLDDYASAKCSGVAEAVVEYLATSDDYQVWDMRTEQLMLVKR